MTIDEVVTKVHNDLYAFLASEVHAWMVEWFTARRPCYIESPRTPNFDGMKLYLDYAEEVKGVTLWAEPDFGVVVADNEYLILDWKT